MTRDDLERLRADAQELRLLEERIAYEQERLLRATAALTGMPGAGLRADLIAEGVANLELLRERYTFALRDHAARVRDAERAIFFLPGDQRGILRLRYIEGRPWEEVARLMCFNVRWCFELHKRAMGELITKN